MRPAETGRSNVMVSSDSSGEGKLSKRMAVEVRLSRARVCRWFVLRPCGDNVVFRYR